ncbi:glycosyltransferase family 2 protein [Nocardioides sp. CFH 31398]|uniref:glycosyltransferase family 2 protein n=1 Tax=Nocardioides sp. CFH 31398 TaxID=2919579 RepID=UPI001F06035B|nr:glycosyltransferase family 2 protein [Nocardioides sp. CFH 31398]MCH1867598.1 glycosyltransferase family 2 protein [Nocardioides sp. CFH 31398]
MEIPPQVVPAAPRHRARPADDLTVIVPAYNEAASIADTVRSILGQSTPPARVVVVDDFSTDGTGDLARAAGAEVLRPDANTGSKAGAQNVALTMVETTYTMAIDADTTLAPDALELLMEPLAADETVVAACGFVVPRHVSTVWERGRYTEYLLSFTFYKPTQDHFGTPLISSGCFSAYRTAALKAAGGWSERTRAEDMDLTWTFYQAGHRVRFVPEAVCYPIEPHDLDFLGKQLRRWSHGFVQNVALHWRGIVRLPFLGTVVGVALFDAVVASLVYLFVLPLLAVLLSPWVLLAYVVDVPAVLVPVLVAARRRGEVGRALASLPSFLVLRLVNGLYMLEALVTEVVLRRPLEVYEKGH